ncbi:hypothetical protein AWB69_08030 [Caballeronia udeis]|uniref:Uncharacterized protein n=1 Tax=Caballeronia udeis TaxID=1232866 RepID=A0A158JJK4_9BURK|nr:hypothetical protein AWB69_08030 [Caballeronia udeis]
MSEISSSTLQMFKRISTATIATALYKRGFRQQ